MEKFEKHVFDLNSGCGSTPFLQFLIASPKTIKTKKYKQIKKITSGMCCLQQQLLEIMCCQKTVFIKNSKRICNIIFFFHEQKAKISHFFVGFFFIF
jgi:hypothetical protein